ncbi:hypothetical protein CVT26_008296 [Gymnopilus dilepis]|uniref:DNA2/NAM7 helicase-like C-terminal domain-containing protein n=1 Tax=Gymnopilus dilepis TaxID=231916 RepID=A0A409W9E4_9AGAR|nr:hypothetical protein CVT26_008296 [Gymnopilus dilepis]
MEGKKNLTATDLATHQHFRCDLYIYNLYHGRSGPGPGYNGASPSEISKAHFQRGIDWEASLLSWLECKALLLKVPSKPFKSEELLENILADERNHFFVAGLSFWPPQRELDQRFLEEHNTPIKFGLAKPDLLEIWKNDRRIIWRVIDAKASRHFNVIRNVPWTQTSHQIQIYFYTLCLTYLLRQPCYQSTDTAGVWLAPNLDLDTRTHSMDDIKTISISLLAPIFDGMLFKELPKVLGLPDSQVRWHYNPLCRGCRYEPECRRRAMDDGELGSLPNISLEDFKVLKELLRISRASFHRPSDQRLPDIEELHELFEDRAKIDFLSSHPSTFNKAKKVLAIPKKLLSNRLKIYSPIVEASRGKEIQALKVIPRRNFRCPSKEDIAIVISVIDDPSSPSRGGDYFCVTVHSEQARIIRPPILVRSPGDLISKLADLIRSVESLNSVHSANTCQFYIWSTNEHAALQNTIIQAALGSEIGREDIQSCIGALFEGASLLQTTFQPLLLSGALISFLARKRRTKADYKVCLERMGLSTDGTINTLHARLASEVLKLQHVSGYEGRRKVLAEPPRIVVLKTEIERQLALPVPGYWCLQECVRFFLPSARPCPSNEQIFTACKKTDNGEALEDLLNHRNRMIYQVLQVFRGLAKTERTSFLVNKAVPLAPRFLDLCKEVSIRKLFFMQQFEVVSKLSELWQSRIDGCPDAPVLQFQDVAQGPSGVELVFRLISGIVDVPRRDRVCPLFDKLLVPETARSAYDDDSLPVEILFDDLGVADLVFPLNSRTRDNWAKQDHSVQQELLIADVQNVCLSDDREHTMVTIRVWGTGCLEFREGKRYRLSSRLVDFNTSKILSNLLEMDILWESRERSSQIVDHMHAGLPFLQLITDSKSLGLLPMAKQYLKAELKIQKQFCDLMDLGNVSAGSLVLKDSQHQATRQILANRLAIIWGPPGTGKTYTIALSLLRIIAVERQFHGPRRQVMFITANTHAAVEACYRRLRNLMGIYVAVSPMQKSWLDGVNTQNVCRGTSHPPPPEGGSGIDIYAGTMYQLHNFAKKHLIEVDCVVVDEAGQVTLGSISLVVRYLRPQGRIIVAGDPEQLAPILSAKYPLQKSQALFGSVLDCLMPLRSLDKQPEIRAIQLIENFRLDFYPDMGLTRLLQHPRRLNPDLGEFISTIYPHQFKPQKVQEPMLAEALSRADAMPDTLTTLPKELTIPIRKFIASLSNVMLHKGAQNILLPPINHVDRVRYHTPEPVLPNQAVSLALVCLRSWSKYPQGVSYEMHVQIEAVATAALVNFLQACCPNDDIFVATPRRVQREAVRQALANSVTDDSLVEEFGRMGIGAKQTMSKITVDTVERLQGSEASFVLCLFSLPRSAASDLDFLLDRRRLNVAFSRAKTLCILITSDEVLQPPAKVLSDENIRKGYTFLKAYQQRAWSYHLPLQAEKVLSGGIL